MQAQARHGSTHCLRSLCRQRETHGNMPRRIVQQTVVRCRERERESKEEREIRLADVNILESFCYVDEWQTKAIPYLNSFMLDSGAFTFFTQGKHVNWEEYIEKYADYIKQNDIKLFFELDIDKLVGYQKVLQYRKKLEKLAGRPCIPVWHKSRGLDTFIDMCKEYKYVAIGGIVSQEITRDQYKHFPRFIATAHRYGAKIHGLGFTNLDGLTKYRFDSVDSTAWLSGNKFGHIYQFNGKTIVKHNVPAGKKLKDSKSVAINNFDEWTKFCIYARKYL